MSLDPRLLRTNASQCHRSESTKTLLRLEFEGQQFRKCVDLRSQLKSGQSTNCLHISTIDASALISKITESEKTVLPASPMSTTPTETQLRSALGRAGSSTSPQPIPHCTIALPVEPKVSAMAQSRTHEKETTLMIPESDNA